MGSAADAPTVFFVGAGISYPAPSRLPLFSHLREAIVGPLDPRFRRRVERVAPEPLFRSLALARVCIEEVFLRVFNAAEAIPNAAHHALAHRLASGDYVWTTNYDTLIEDALRQLIASPRDRAEALSRLNKPHGTFVRDDDGPWVRARDLIFSADQVAVEWPEDQRQALLSCVRGRRLVIAGYSGVDINAYSALRRALLEASGTTWFWLEPSDDHDAALRELLFRFPELHENDVRLSKNPSSALLTECRSTTRLQKLGSLSEHDRECPVEGTRADLALLSRHVSAASVQAIVARELGERFAERDLLNEAIVGGIRSAIPRVLLVRHSPRAQLLRGYGRELLIRLPTWTPATERVRARSVSDRPALSAHHGQRLAMRVSSWSGAAKRPLYKARLLLELSRLRRFNGDLDGSVKASATALRVARTAHPPLVTEAARATMEQMESLRALGRFNDCFEVARLRLHTLGMSHWGAWIDYELGCIYLQLRSCERAAEHLDRAARFFDSIHSSDPETSYDPVPGQLFTILARLATHRTCGSLDEAQRCALTVKKQISHTSAGLTLRCNIEFQLAELARAVGDVDAARSHYDEVDPAIDIFGGLVALGVALCSWDTPAFTNCLERARESFERQHSVFGLAYVAMFEESSGTTLEWSRSVRQDALSLAREIWGADLQSIGSSDLPIAYA